MVALLAFCIIIVIIAFLLCYAVDQGQVQPPLNPILKVIIILIAVLLIAHEARLI